MTALPDLRRSAMTLRLPFSLSLLFWFVGFCWREHRRRVGVYLSESFGDQEVFEYFDRLPSIFGIWISFPMNEIHVATGFVVKGSIEIRTGMYGRSPCTMMGGASC
jgi:hypothetical protein